METQKRSKLFESSGFPRRPQNLKHSSNVRLSGRLLQIFVAFSECSNLDQKGLLKLLIEKKKHSHIAKK